MIYSQLLPAQTAGLGLLGWALVFFVLVPIISGAFSSGSKEEPPKSNP
jgi:hypothetical protein